VSLLYGRGQFDQGAVDTTSVILLGFGFGMWAQVLGYTFVKILNARGANGRATAVMVLSFASAIAVNLLLFRQWGAFTLGAAASICGLVMVVASAWALGILRFSAGVLTIMAPGALLAGVAGYAAAGPGWIRLILSVTAVFAVWIGYAMAVPQLRQPLLATIRRRTGLPADAVPQARDGNEEDPVSSVTPGSTT
jgi:putative peptidoglycan lipid II flippase